MGQTNREMQREPQKGAQGKAKGRRERVLWEMFSTALYILCILALTILFITFVGQRTDVDGSSMETTLQDEDKLWVNKIGYRLHDPERFDIIVFPYKHAEKTYFIKRIIALPGETVRIDLDGRIFINGEILEESYGREVIDPAHIGIAIDEITLGDDEYFVMGDNRNNSTDSRFEQVGNIKREDIIGRAVFRLWPLSGFGRIK